MLFLSQDRNHFDHSIATIPTATDMMLLWIFFVVVWVFVLFCFPSPLWNVYSWSVQHEFSSFSTFLPEPWLIATLFSLFVLLSLSYSFILVAVFFLLIYCVLHWILMCLLKVMCQRQRRRHQLYATIIDLFTQILCVIQA